MTKYNEGAFIVSKRTFFLGENYTAKQQASDRLIHYATEWQFSYITWRYIYFSIPLTIKRRFQLRFTERIYLYIQFQIHTEQSPDTMDYALPE